MPFTPTIQYERVFRELFVMLSEAAKHLGGMEVFGNRSDLRFGEGTLAPDLFLIYSEADTRPKSWSDVPVPFIAVEIVDHTTAESDRDLKRIRHWEAGVVQYWIVDIDERVVERWWIWAAEAEQHTEEIIFWSQDRLGRRVDLNRLWAEVGERRANHANELITSQPRGMTVEALWALPEDGFRHELYDGVHVVLPRPSSQHQLAVSNLLSALIPAMKRHGAIECFLSRTDIVLDPRTVVQPDFILFDSPPGTKREQWSEIPLPFLIIEIVSPETAARDRGSKLGLYRAADVEEYWIVDVDAETVERWRRSAAEAEVVRDRLAFSMGNGFSGEVDLKAIWDV